MLHSIAAAVVMLPQPYRLPLLSLLYSISEAHIAPSTKTTGKKKKQNGEGKKNKNSIQYNYIKYYNGA